MTRTAPNQNALKGTATMLFAGLVIALVAALIAAAPARSQDGYSYLRTVEGYASLESTDEGSLEAVENQPLIPGDALVVGSSSRVEAILADGTVVRFGGPGELRFDALAFTADTGDTSTRLYLAEGEMQLVLSSDIQGPLEVTTVNATLYLEAPGEYRVKTSGSDSTSVVVREGFAEAQTDRGSAILRSGETGYVDGYDWANIEVAVAERRSSLESWGDELDAEARLAEIPYVEPTLRYRAARMANYGTWVEVGDRWGWQPHVSAGWRPYVHGDWRYTPSGLTWVSSEPWGWVPSHYGSWDLVPGFGWTWFAGSYYSPASVYWYWGPTHVGWVPAGYYTSFYAPGLRVAPRFGVYGWAGGDWGFFAEWTFCPTRYFGRSQYDRYFRSGYEVGLNASYREIPRGVIATDTRSLGRDVWGDPDRIATRLIATDSRLSSGSLPDVTDFVARRKDVRPEIAEIVRPQEVAKLGSRSRATSTVLRDGEVRDIRSRDTMSRDTGTRDTRLGERAPAVTRDAEPRLGRPTIERRSMGETRFDDRGSAARDSSAVSRSRNFDAPDRELLEPRSYDRPTVERPGPERYQILQRGIPTRGQGEDPRLQLGSSGSAPSRDAAGSSDGDDRAVVRRVIEQMRSRQAPVASSSATGSTRSAAPPRASSADPRSPSTSRQGASPSTSSSSSSRVRSSTGDSRSSTARSSSSKPPARQSTSSRSSSRKPPGD